jgi:hypothetical protein
LESGVLPARMDLLFQRLDSAGQPVGGHAHACQALLFQEVDFVNQGNHLRSFERSRFFTPGSLELQELAYEGGEAGFMIFMVKPCSMPSPEGVFQGRIKKAITTVSL